MTRPPILPRLAGLSGKDALPVPSPVRHFMLAKDGAERDAASEGHAPFYARETDHFIAAEQYQNR